MASGSPSSSRKAAAAPAMSVAAMQLFDVDQLFIMKRSDPKAFEGKKTRVAVLAPGVETEQKREYNYKITVVDLSSTTVYRLMGPHQHLANLLVGQVLDLADLTLQPANEMWDVVWTSGQETLVLNRKHPHGGVTRLSLPLVDIKPL